MNRITTTNYVTLLISLQFVTWCSSTKNFRVTIFWSIYETFSENRNIFFNTLTHFLLFYFLQIFIFSKLQLAFSTSIRKLIENSDDRGFIFNSLCFLELFSFFKSMFFFLCCRGLEGLFTSEKRRQISDIATREEKKKSKKRRKTAKRFPREWVISRQVESCYFSHVIAMFSVLYCGKIWQICFWKLGDNLLCLVFYVLNGL